MYYTVQVVVGTKQDLERGDLPYEEIEATVRKTLLVLLRFSLINNRHHRCHQHYHLHQQTIQ